MTHSPKLAETILRLSTKLSKDKEEAAVVALRALGPGCFFDDCENEEQAKGAILLLEWIEAYIDYEPKGAA